MKTLAIKFPIALASRIIVCILPAVLTMNCFAQPSQAPQPGTFIQVIPGQSHPAQNSNHRQQNFQPAAPASPMGATANDIMEQSFRMAEQRMGAYINRPYLAPEQNQRARQAYYVQQPGYENPSAENDFNQITPKMKLDREMDDLLKEIQLNHSIVRSKAYYSSDQYLNDLPRYMKARNQIKEMLEGKRKLSIKDAYFIAESAYGNLHLTYDEYNQLIKENAGFILQYVVENGYDPQDPEAIHLGIQKFLSDSLYIGNNTDKLQIKKLGHLPYYYDYLDITAGTDRRNYFVTKTLATGSGQCHTLPVIYLILAEALGVEAHLAYNPVHSFIRYKNNKGTIVNYETTVDRFLPDPFYLQTLPVMATAQKNNIYISSLSKKQVVASVLLDLAVNFVMEHWLSDKTFIRECMRIAMPYFPNQDYINTANDYLHKRLYADAFNSKVQEKGMRDLNEIEKYPEVLQAYNNYRNYMEKVSKLGIQDFPESEYLRLMEYYDYKGKLQIAKNMDAKSRKNLFFNQ